MFVVVFKGKHESKRDFVKENSRQIKNIQRSNRLCESEREPFKVTHISEKSKDVKSKDKSIEVQVRFRKYEGICCLRNVLFRKLPQ